MLYALLFPLSISPFFCAMTPQIKHSQPPKADLLIPYLM